MIAKSVTEREKGRSHVQLFVCKTLLIVVCKQVTVTVSLFETHQLKPFNILEHLQ